MRLKYRCFGDVFLKEPDKAQLQWLGNLKLYDIMNSINLNFTYSLVCDEVKIENVKSVLQDFIKRHSLVGFDVK